MTDEAEKAKAEKESIDAMRNAQKHMAKALDRIENLQRALRKSCDTIEAMIAYLPSGTYGYRSEESLRDHYAKTLGEIRKVLI